MLETITNSKRYIITFSLFTFLLILTFFLGRHYPQNSSFTEFKDAPPLYTNKKQEQTIDVSGYYVPLTGESAYILVKQKGSEVSISGYASSSNLVGDWNVGEFSATTTVDSQGLARLNLSQEASQASTCIMYLLFYRKETGLETSSTSESGSINSVRVIQTDSGSNCSFGNNVSFDLGNDTYEKQKTAPSELPTSRG